MGQYSFHSAREIHSICALIYKLYPDNKEKPRVIYSALVLDPAPKNEPNVC